jgi:hypothetical protein
MTKKKSSKRSKRERRKKEVIKAQIKSGMRENVIGKLVDEDVIDTKPKRVTHRLPIKEIKTDLIKTALFAVFVVVFLLLLKTQGLEFNFGINK